MKARPPPPVFARRQVRGVVARPPRVRPAGALAGTVARNGASLLRAMARDTGATSSRTGQQWQPARRPATPGGGGWRAVAPPCNGATPWRGCDTQSKCHPKGDCPASRAGGRGRCGRQVTKKPGGKKTVADEGCGGNGFGERRRCGAFDGRGKRPTPPALIDLSGPSSLRARTAVLAGSVSGAHVETTPGEPAADHDFPGWARTKALCCGPAPTTTLPAVRSHRPA